MSVLIVRAIMTKTQQISYESMEKINLSLRSFETGNLSTDNLKKRLDLDGSILEPAVRSGDTGQRIPCFDSCQLITTLMCNYFFPGLLNLLDSVRVNIGCPVVRTDGRSFVRSFGVRSRDYQIFLDG